MFLRKFKTFSAILNQTKIPFDLLAFTCGFCSKVPIRRRDINDVNIIGTISKSHKLQNGTQSLIVRTLDPSHKHSDHHIHINTDLNPTVGQRINILGSLSSDNVKTADGKIVSSSVVKASKLHLLKNECGTSDLNTGDQCSVKILAKICTNIIVNDRNCSFSIVTHFVNRNEQGKETNGSYVHRVFVYKRALGQYVANNLSKNDRIVMNGRIGWMTNRMKENNKEINSGFIVASSINKLLKVNNAEDESNEKTGVDEDINVNIIGTVDKKSYMLDDDTQALIVRSFDSPVKYANHTIPIGDDVDITVGQRIFTLGSLSSTNVQNSDGNLVRSSIIKPHKFYLLENERGTSTSNSGDQSSVKIFANISSNIKVDEKDCSFSVTTDFVNMNESNKESNKQTADTHDVIVYDYGVRQYIQNHLKKSDQILIHGHFGHNIHYAINHKKFYSGFIIADNIYKYQK